MKHLFIALASFISFNATAQYGALDSDFDADGKLLLEFGNNTTLGYDVLVQDDGKILVCGWYIEQNEPAFHISRLLPDGSFDNSFGVLGTSIVILNGVQLQIYAMALQPDGKIIVVGGVNGGQIGQVVMRLNASDGFLDTSFGTNGMTIIPYSVTSFLYDVAVQADGKIVACGITAESDLDVTVVRLNADGSMDNSFSFDGKAVTDVNTADWAQGLVIGSDGKITTAGSTEHGGGNTNTLLVRYNDDGSLDDTFGTNGKLETDLANTVDEFHNIAMTGSGKMYAVGAIDAGSDYDMLIAKFNADGTLDNSFSFDGVVEIDYAFEDDRAWDVLIQPDGKILVVGTSENISGKSLAILRLTNIGLQDITFGSSGLVVTDLGTSDEFKSVALQEDLKILAAGWANSNGQKAVVARYTSGMNVGIGEVDAYIGSTLVYPNPVSEQITVEFELKSQQSITIELSDLEGKVISMLQPKTELVSGDHSVKFSLPRVASGQYLLRLNTTYGSVNTILSIPR